MMEAPHSNCSKKNVQLQENPVPFKIKCNTTTSYWWCQTARKLAVRTRWSSVQHDCVWVCPMDRGGGDFEEGFRVENTFVRDHHLHADIYCIHTMLL